MLNAAVQGLMAEGLGLSIGILLLYVFKIKNDRIIGMLFGMTSGLMLAMICFDVLPEAFKSGSMTLVFWGIILGGAVGVLLDELVPFMQQKMGYEANNTSKMALVLALGIGFHNIPEGFALGTIVHGAPQMVGGFTLIMAIHSIPEGIAMAIPFKKAGMSLEKLLGIACFLGMMMGLGAILGFVFSSKSKVFICIGLGIAAGLILYIVCGELIPESRKIWNGRMTTLATILGVLLGILLLYE